MNEWKSRLLANNHDERPVASPDEAEIASLKASLESVYGRVVARDMAVAEACAHASRISSELELAQDALKASQETHKAEVARLLSEVADREDGEKNLASRVEDLTAQLASTDAELGRVKESRGILLASVENYKAENEKLRGKVAELEAKASLQRSFEALQKPPVCSRCSAPNPSMVIEGLNVCMKCHLLAPAGGAP